MFNLIDNLVILTIVAAFGCVFILIVMTLEHYSNKKKQVISEDITKAKEEACDNRKR